MHTKRLLTFAVATAILLVVAACGDSEDGATSAAPATTTSTTATTTQASTTSTTAATTTTTSTTPPPEHAIAFDTTAWPELVKAHYEGWLIIDGAAVSTGRFNVVAGEAVDLDGEPVDEFALDFDPTAASAVVVSIEPAGDSDPAPSDTHILAGDIADGSAPLSIDHPAALGTDFATASGEFVLATPTDGDRVNDEFSGVWFLTFPGPTPGLDLPTLPDGWIYEGWTVIEGIPVTTGTFSRVDASDNEAPYSGTVRTPNFPGEDYLQNAPDGLTFPTNLQGATVVISVEPLAEDNPQPFALKPLAGPVPADAELEPVAYPLTTAEFTPLSGIATLR